ncbi:inner membrane protein YhjD [Nocardia sp. CDC159]|uniref:Inner membrane protein YhjD n=1 Tax=Nocardia pulmonis TaxID=2951408 RepID=A0A9X2ECK7_9NOCA|nr:MULTISPECIES: inner membrane protein YhjD [Nocardia]MCM6777994.1 inner membrane protein YhjD [Nocardia pulmonis]MCM6790835.1 inner membrane protein YhjD [Nocardia sp. CDC159]
MFDKIRGRIEREVQARPWLDHAIRAGGRYQRQRGDYYAAGITYFTVLSLFPLLMVGFAVTGFVLSRNPELLREVQDKVVENIPGSLGGQLNDLIDQAIKSRTSVGVIGLLGAGYGGLGWMANLRAALTEQWEQKVQEGNWFTTKLSDLLALVGLGLAMVVSLGLSALAGSGLGLSLLRLVRLDKAPGVGIVLTIVSLLLAVIASWAVFVWIIARLPRQPVTIVSAVKAALIAAIAFEIWKQIASFYLKKVVTSPAGVAFGPIIGLMVFAYITARIILFATAWAATARENEEQLDVEPPPPAVIEPRMSAGMSAGAGAVLFGAGAAVAALATGLLRRKSGSPFSGRG